MSAGKKKMKKWNIKKISDIATVVRGGSPRPAGDQRYFDGGYIPWLTVGDLTNISDAQLYITKTGSCLTEEGAKHSRTLSSGTIVISNSGATLGVAKIIGVRCCANDGIAALTNLLEGDKRYICEYINSKTEYFREVLAPGNGQPNLNTDLIGNVHIPLPPPFEQRAIAELLSTWDAAIEKTERLIAAKENVISSYGQRLFDPKRASKKIGWEVVILNKVLTEHSDLSTGKEEVFSVSVHKGLINQIEHLGRSFSASDTSNYNRVHFGDIVYTKSPTGNFPLGIVKQSHVSKDVIVSPLYGVFTPQTNELGVILDFYFQSPLNALNYLRPIVHKGAKNTINVTNSTFLSGKLNLPLARDEQKHISAFIMVARREIDELKILNEMYKRQKRGLMQKLLVGDWRVQTKGALS